MLLAEHASELSSHFLFPWLSRPGTGPQPGQQARHGHAGPGARVPGARLAFASTDEQVAAVPAATAAFPAVVKNSDPWLRRRAPAVAGTTVVRSSARADRAGLVHPGAPALLLQEIHPARRGRGLDRAPVLRRLRTAWCCSPGSRPDPGRRRRRHRVRYRGAQPRPGDQVERFCKAVGFHGVADLDIRFDRDEQYKLVDFNPRVGNQFRLFQTAGGIDVIRRPVPRPHRPAVPPGGQVNGRRIVVEHIHPLSRAGERGSGYTHRRPRLPGHGNGTRLAGAGRSAALPRHVAEILPLTRDVLPRPAAAASRRRKHHDKDGDRHDRQTPPSSSGPGPTGCRSPRTSAPGAAGHGCSAR